MTLDRNFGENLKMSQDHLKDTVNKKIDNDVTSTPISQLTDECLYQLFLYIPVPDRIRIERVCKQWQRASKKSWEYVEKLVITSPRDRRRSIIEGVKEFVSLRTLNLTIICSVLSRCGRYLKDFALEEFHEPFEMNILPIISNYCHNIENIDIMELENPLQKGLNQLFNCNANVKAVTIVQCDEEIDQCIQYLNPQKLEQLVLIFSKEYSSLYYLNEFLKDAHSLKYLKLREYFVDANTIEFIGNLQSLQDLRLISLEPDDLSIHESFAHIGKLKNLRTLSLNGKGVTDELLKQIVNNSRKLKSLSLSGCHDVTHEGLETIATLPQLKSLNISNLSSLNNKSLINLRTLEFFRCAGCKSFSDKGIVSLIRNSPNLIEIYILYCGIANEKEVFNAAAGAVEMRNNGTVLKLVVHGCKNYNNYEDFLPYVQIITYDNDDENF